MSPRQINENVAWISGDRDQAHAGHLTSCCDPYLCLLVELLDRTDVVHVYMGATVTYRTTRRMPLSLIHI